MFFRRSGTALADSFLLLPVSAASTSGCSWLGFFLFSFPFLLFLPWFARPAPRGLCFMNERLTYAPLRRVHVRVHARSRARERAKFTCAARCNRAQPCHCASPRVGILSHTLTGPHEERNEEITESYKPGCTRMRNFRFAQEGIIICRSMWSCAPFDTHIHIVDSRISGITRLRDSRETRPDNSINED